MSSLTFRVVGRNDPQPRERFPFVELRWDHWDDYSFKTMLGAKLHIDAGSALDLGGVKILRRGQEEGFTDLPETFESLDDEFVSLGQDIEYYERLIRDVPESLRLPYLWALRDAALDPGIERAFVSERGWETSVLRFGQAVNALEIGREMLQGITRKAGLMSFQFDWKRGEVATPIDFDFRESSELPGRCQVLIGYNGVGKTTLLADLALAASRGREEAPVPTDSTLTGDDTTFGAVVAVSYSAFDTFRTPEESVRPSPSALGDDDVDRDAKDSGGRTEVFGYVYCGLRITVKRSTAAMKRFVHPDNGSEEPDGSYELKSIGAIEREFARALGDVGRRKSARPHLVEAFQALSEEPSFGRAGVDLGLLGSGVDSADAIAAFRQLSTGHKIVLNIVAQLAAHLRTRSLVLIDEPESHLHPPLTAALLRALQVLLRGWDSFAVVATHSPVVVQEVPSQQVKILERYIDDVSVQGPEIETFGENIGSITRHIFSLDSSATDYQGTLAALARRFSLDEIDDLFANGISAQARALVLNYQARQ
ncbi:MAG: AAA family ATPase [Aeromicrobium sp.]|uniref:AAA family ATPase n=1 Tax=Aeromicrobium sp. TaxID=1871063 RepID=UPI00260A4FDD|nr:AAA family ATPase [Aeromicrobium sp.]MDF1705824.1 AAA family ATPase [Aeromicrobium sp.]